VTDVWKTKGHLVCERLKEIRNYSKLKGPVKHRNIHTGGSGVSDISRSLDLKRT